MDATFNLNDKNCLLITLFTIDDFGNGIPLAFCISEKEDEATITTFLECVKQTVGQISSDFFLSDDAGQYFKSWSKVMKHCKKILCSWHVLKNWKENLNSKLNGLKDKDVVMNNILKKLIHIKDLEIKEHANDKFSKYVNELISNKSTKSFGQYLKSYYLKRTSEFFTCERPIFIPNTNMHIESFHKLIKYIYLKSNRIKKISNLIEVLKEIVCQVKVDRIVKLKKRKNNKKSRSNYQNHPKAMSKSNLYSIELFHNQDEVYEVYQVFKNDKINIKYYLTVNYNDHNCNNYCKLCKTCPHQISCSCIRYRLKNEMCKHVHMLSLKFGIVNDSQFKLKDPSIDHENDSNLEFNLDFDKNFNDKKDNLINNI